MVKIKVRRGVLAERQGKAVGGEDHLFAVLRPTHPALGHGRIAFQKALALKALLPALAEMAFSSCMAGPRVFLPRLLEEDGQGSEKCRPPPHSCQREPCGQNLDRPS